MIEAWEGDGGRCGVEGGRAFVGVVFLAGGVVSKHVTEKPALLTSMLYLNENC